MCVCVIVDMVLSHFCLRSYVQSAHSSVHTEYEMWSAESWVMERLSVVSERIEGGCNGTSIDGPLVPCQPALSTAWGRGVEVGLGAVLARTNDPNQRFDVRRLPLTRGCSEDWRWLWRPAHSAILNVVGRLLVLRRGQLSVGSR